MEDYDTMDVADLFEDIFTSMVKEAEADVETAVLIDTVTSARLALVKSQKDRTDTTRGRVRYHQGSIQTDGSE